jgi:hypothetical protein
MQLASKAKAPFLRYAGTLQTYIETFRIFYCSETVITKNKFNRA